MPAPSHPSFPCRNPGFTLVELVVVIVLIGILSLVGANLIGNFVGGYIEATERQELASTGRIAVERATRELRRAVPNSVLCPPGSNCNGVEEIAFLRVATGGRYVATGPSQSRLQINRPNDRFVAYGLQDLDLANHHLVVYPQQADPLYGSAGGGPRSKIDNANSSDLSTPPTIRHRLQLGDNDSFPRHSPARRIYGVNKVVSLCCDPGAGELNLGIGELQDSLGTSPGHYCNEANGDVDVHLLAEGVSDCRITYREGTLTRSALVRLYLALQSPESDETVDFLQEVQVRNVP